MLHLPNLSARFHLDAFNRFAAMGMHSFQWGHIPHTLPSLWGSRPPPNTMLRLPAPNLRAKFHLDPFTCFCTVTGTRV